MKTPLIVSDPDILDGTPVFAGTRVPVKNFPDCLEARDATDDFLEDFPTITRMQLSDFLEEARVRLTTPIQVEPETRKSGDLDLLDSRFQAQSLAWGQCEFAFTRTRDGCGFERGL